MKHHTTIRACAMVFVAVSLLISACARKHIRETPDEMLFAALLGSDFGINLADYAVIGNELEWAGRAERAAVLKRHKLSEAQWKSLGQTFDLRMSENRALVDYYEASAFRVAKGRFAAYGRDLANSYMKGEDLRLDPPLPIDETGMLNGRIAAIWKVAGSSESERLEAKADVLARYGLSPYDYTIVNGWWLRKAQVAEMHGDYSIMHALVDAERAAMDFEREGNIGSEQVLGNAARKADDEH